MKRLTCGRVLGVVFTRVFFVSFLIVVAHPGAAWPAASITGIFPDHGPRGANTTLTIKGENLSPRMRAAIWGGGIYVKGSHGTKGPANGLFCSGSYAYLACGQEERGSDGCGVQIFHIQDPADPRPVSFFSLPRKAHDIIVFENYAYVATGSGVQILNVQDPSHPFLVSSLPIAGETLRISLYGRYLYAASDSGGLQIVDIGNPNQPALAGSCLTPKDTGTRDTHDIYVLDVVAEGSYAYLAAGWAGVKIIDISKPGNPAVVASFSRPGRFVMGIYKYQDHLYLSEMQDGVEILDIEAPLLPVVRSQLTTPGLCHRVSIRGNYLYVADDYRGVEIFRHDLDAGCSLVGFQKTPGWAVDAQVFDNHIFVADSHGGFQILDAANPGNPAIVSLTDLLDGATGVKVSGLTVQGTYAYVLSRTDSSFEDNWLKILDISDPKNPFVCGMTRNIGAKPEGLAISQGYAYLMDGDIGLQVLNVTYRQSPQRVSFHDSDTSGGKGIFMRDNTLFLADSLASKRAGLKILSLDAKMLPAPLGVRSLDAPLASAEAVFATQKYAFLAAGDAGLAIFDIQNPDKPSLIVTLPLSGNSPGSAGSAGSGGASGSGGSIGSIRDVLVCEPYAWLADKNGRVQALDIGTLSSTSSTSTTPATSDTPTTPDLAGSCQTMEEPLALSLSGNYLYAAEGEAGFQAIDITEPQNPLAVASLPALTPAEDVVAEGEYIYAAIGNGLMIARAFKPCSAVSSADSETLSFSTPKGLAPGTYHVTLTDPNGTTTLFPNGFTIEANRPPVMEPLADNPMIAIVEGETLTLTIKATDPDGDPLIYAASLSKLPSGATMVGNVFSWKPGPEDSGLYPDIRFQVSDGDSIVEQEVNLAVIDNGTNTPPVLDPIGEKTVSEGDTLSFTLSATCAEGGILHFSATSLPFGAQLEGSTFFWKPDSDQSGTYSITFTVQEGSSGLMDSEEIGITVLDTNSPPEPLLVSLEPGINVWFCPAGRAGYTSFTFLRELGADAVYSLQAYDWDGTLLKSCSWFFENPSGDNFLMDQSRIYRIQAKKNISFTWP
ncbi:MAG: putative Ig domain-containing protein [bacterium]